MRTKKIKVTCPKCHGSGYTTAQYGANEPETTEGCRKCGGSGDDYNSRKMRKGTGQLTVKFEILKNKCEYCAGSGKLDCTTVEHGTGFFGEYRKEKSFRKKCDYCLGEGRQLIAFFRSRCPDCGGCGKEYYWQKGLFGNEYKKERRCRTCSGKGRVEEKSSHIFKDDLSSFWEY